MKHAHNQPGPPPKPDKPSRFRPNRLVLAADFILIVAVLGTLSFALLQHRQQAAKEATVCHAPAKNYQLTVDKDVVSQADLHVHLCDTITVTNADTQSYWFNFGTHENHIDYPGYDAQVQAPNESINIDALEMGSFQIHDHYRDKAVLNLTVGPKQKR